MRVLFVNANVPLPIVVKISCNLERVYQFQCSNSMPLFNQKKIDAELLVISFHRKLPKSLVLKSETRRVNEYIFQYISSVSIFEYSGFEI